MAPFILLIPTPFFGGMGILPVLEGLKAHPTMNFQGVEEKI